MNPSAQFFGLPLHPLLVHAVVVLLPLAALALMLAQFWPAVRRRLGLVTPVAALIVAALVPFTIAAGQSLAAAVGPLPSVLEHERHGRMLLPWSIGLALVAAVQWTWFRWGETTLRRTRRERTAVTGSVLLGAAVILVSIGSVATVVLAGHSGSQSVWGSLMP